MILKDSVYGTIEINDPVLLELIKSKPVQRLKGILQAGVLYKVLPWKNFTRYDHSIGVMLLLNLKGAPLEEQIAGLIHDVPHTAFSHAIDFVYKSKNFDFHEKFHESMILDSEIPKILEKHGFEVKKILDEKNFSLLEKSLPDLCADRIDYTLREFVSRDGHSEKIKKYFDSIIVENNQFVFNKKSIALQFSQEFLEMIQSWGSPLELVIVETIASVIKEGLEVGIINEKDLFKTDKEVLEKLEKSNNKKIIDLLSILNPKLRVISDEKNFDYYSKEKVRYIDPLVAPTLKRVSEIYPAYARLLEEHKSIMSKGVYAKIVSG